MPNVTVTQELKHAVKEALRETLQEQRNWLHEVFAEALEDFALAQAIRKGRRSKKVSRADVFRILDGKS